MDLNTSALHCLRHTIYASIFILHVVSQKRFVSIMHSGKYPGEICRREPTTRSDNTRRKRFAQRLILTQKGISRDKLSLVQIGLQPALCCVNIVHTYWCAILLGIWFGSGGFRFGGFLVKIQPCLKFFRMVVIHDGWNRKIVRFEVSLEHFQLSVNDF